MPAAAVKGLILSLSIIAALSVAVLENPQVQEWLEEQRKKIAELLRSLGEELDPASRRAAEAFAFNGRTPATDDSLRREATGSRDAAAIATGRSLSPADASVTASGSVRRIPIQGAISPEEAEERQRKGREYLAKRNQQMYELRQRRKTSQEEADVKPPSPTSFDALVDKEGKLFSADDAEKLPSAPTNAPLSQIIADGAQQNAEIETSRYLAIGEAITSSSAWQLGSQLANPFGDEFALDRSETPKPPVPPKVELDRGPESVASSSAAQIRPIEREATMQNHDDLSYEEQLAIALSLSEAESQANDASSQRSDVEREDTHLKAAIEASLREMEENRAAGIHSQFHQGPLVDFSSLQALPNINAGNERSYWDRMFDGVQHSRPVPQSDVRSASARDHDELYDVTPQLTGARPANFKEPRSPSQATTSLPFDPVREAAKRLAHTAIASAGALGDLSFYSAQSSAQSPSRESHSPKPEQEHPLIDFGEEPIRREKTPTPTSGGTSVGFQTDSDSESDTFASVYGTTARVVSPPRSEISNADLVEVVDESDVDLFSEDGDGIATPDSWTEVGSQDGESDAGEHPAQLLQQASRPAS